MLQIKYVISPLELHQLQHNMAKMAICIVCLPPIALTYTNMATCSHLKT